MLRGFRRDVGRHGFSLLLVFLVIGWGVALFRPGPAAADAGVDALRKVALSDVGLNQRLMVLEVLRKDGGTAALNALSDIASRGRLQVASGACAALGRVRTSASRAKLKALLEDTSLGVKVRMSAASCIAVHWEDEGDLSYLEDKCEGNSELEAHCASLASRVYGR